MARQAVSILDRYNNIKVCRWEAALSKALLSREERRQYEIRFNVDGLLRGDYKSRMEGYAVGINNGFMCPNDARRLENMDLIPPEKGGDNFLIQGAMIRLEDAGIYAGRDQRGDTLPDKQMEGTHGKETHN